MDARERILGALKHSEPVQDVDDPPPPAPEAPPEPDSTLRLLAATDQVRQSEAVRPVPPPGPVSPSQDEMPDRRSSSRWRPIWIAVCAIVASAGGASFLMRAPRQPALTPSSKSAPAPAAVASAPAPPSATSPQPTPVNSAVGTEAPYVVTVQSQADAEQRPAEPEQGAARAFVPPPAQPRATNDQVVLDEPAPSIQNGLTTGTSGLPVSVAAAPQPPAFRDKPAPTAVAVVGGGKVEPPQLIRRVAPVYPATARELRTGGRVRFRAIIGKDGRVVKLQKITGPFVLAAAGETAIRQWLYRPAMVDGKPVESETHIEINFQFTDTPGSVSR